MKCVSAEEYWISAATETGMQTLILEDAPALTGTGMDPDQLEQMASMKSKTLL